MSNVVVGGLFVVAGVLVSLLGQVTYDAWRSRKRVSIAVDSVRAVVGRTTTYFRLRRLGEQQDTLASGMINETGWVYASPSEPNSFLVLSFVLNIQNASQLDDALVAVEVAVPTSQGPLTSALPYSAESRFYGAAIPAHGYLALELDFALAASKMDSLGEGHTPTTVSYTLALHTIRGQDINLLANSRLKANPSKSSDAILPQPALPHHFVAESDGPDERPT
ncbi:MAG TPA: hypothetical protein VMV12_06735 [Candidatus Micrarchaeaceae archaeon]|nr:hypothetical protein [Candidatus Micrarchaeaceae archaeon]